METPEQINPWEVGIENSYLTPSEDAGAAPWEVFSGEGMSYLGEVDKPLHSPNMDKVMENVVQQESRGRHRRADGELLTSNKGAKGVTQVMPKTGASPGFGVKPLQDDTEEEYRRFGRDYLEAMLKEFDYDLEKALAAYNAGPGNVSKAVKAGGDSWKDHLPKPQETLPYIEKIMAGIDTKKESSLQELI